MGGYSLEAKMIAYSTYSDELFDAMLKELHSPTPFLTLSSRWKPDLWQWTLDPENFIEKFCTTKQVAW